MHGWPANLAGEKVRCEKSHGLVITDTVCWENCGTLTCGQNVQQKFGFLFGERFCYFKEDDWIISDY